MSLNTVLQQNDAGISVIITITEADGSTPVNLSLATSKTIYISKPNGSLVTGTASLVTDGTDGKIEYVTSPGDLDLVGMYKVQATYTVGLNTKHTQKDCFIVSANVAGLT